MRLLIPTPLFKVPGAKIPEEYIVGVVAVRSPGECAIRCRQHDECFSIAVHSYTGEFGAASQQFCHIHNLKLNPSDDHYETGHSGVIYG